MQGDAVRARRNRMREPNDGTRILNGDHAERPDRSARAERILPWTINDFEVVDGGER